MDGYCERQDVLDVLQEADLSGALGQRPEIVDSAIVGLTEYLRDQTGRHWYDSGTSSLLPTSEVTATEMRYDVPSSPHPTDRQLYNHDVERYPVSTDGPYCRITLDHHDVSTLDALRVRDYSGDVTDWTSDPEYVQGRGEDYYLATPTDGGKAGRTALYVRAAALPAVVDYEGLLTLDYSYGTDSVPESVRRMTALLAASELVVDDVFQQAIPDDGQLVNVQTRADEYETRGERLLDNYRSTPTA